MIETYEVGEVVQISDGDGQWRDAIVAGVNENWMGSVLPGCYRIFDRARSYVDRIPRAGRIRKLQSPAQTRSGDLLIMEHDAKSAYPLDAVIDGVSLAVSAYRSAELRARIAAGPSEDAQRWREGRRRERRQVNQVNYSEED